jgi:hypothetical protein
VKFINERVQTGKSEIDPAFLCVSHLVRKKVACKGLELGYER